MPRYEDEIREILQRMDAFVPEESTRRRLARTLRIWWNDLRRRLAAIAWLPAPDQLMLVTYALALVIWAFGGWFGPLTFYARLLLGLLFVLAYALSLAGLGRPPRRPYWRGRPIDYDPNPWRDWAARRRR